MWRNHEVLNRLQSGLGRLPPNNTFMQSSVAQKQLPGSMLTPFVRLDNTGTKIGFAEIFVHDIIYYTLQTALASP
ncbi:hypothetical protein AFLA_005146 [Aspergillus flavus NRRL3357]|nr:hypothetical protein AFLA_005146 [Aspergillus flavus NRRL3357]